jgi:hypothetical protein
MAMTNVSHIVVGVEVLPAVFVVEVLHRAAYDLYGVSIRDAKIPAEEPLATGYGISFGLGHKLIQEKHILALSKIPPASCRWSFKLCLTRSLS